jgi:type I restriction enzyme S subunit
MNSEYPMSALGELAEFQEGYVNPKRSIAEYFDGDVKWLRAVDLNNSFVHKTSKTLTQKGYESAGKSAFLFPPETLAISKSGTIGRVGIIKDWMCGNRAVINVRPNPTQVDVRFIFYCLITGRSHVEQLAEGSVQKNLYVSQLSQFEVPTPSLEHQKAIAHILGTLDEKIELNQKMNQTL